MSRYLETLFRQKELFLVPFLATPLIALIAMVFVGRQYEVPALIWTESSSFVDPLARAGAGANQREAQAMREWLETETFRKSVMDQTGLTEVIQKGDWPVPSRLSTHLSSIGLDRVPGLGGVLRMVGLAPPATTEAAMDRGLDMIKKTVIVNAEGNNLLKVVYRGKEPVLGKRIVEEIIVLYHQKTMEIRTSEALAGIQFYTGQVQTQEERLQLANDELKRFLEVHPQPAVGVLRPAAEEAELENLRRAYLLEQTLYEGALRRLEQVRIENEAVLSNRELNFQIIDPPQEPELTGFTKRSIAMALIFGLTLGGILGLLPIVILTWLDGTVRAPTDIERVLKAPFIAQAPLVPSNRKQSHSVRSIMARRISPVLRTTPER